MRCALIDRPSFRPWACGFLLVMFVISGECIWLARPGFPQAIVGLGGHWHNSGTGRNDAGPTDRQTPLRVGISTGVFCNSRSAWGFCCDEGLLGLKTATYGP